MQASLSRVVVFPEPALAFLKRCRSTRRAISRQPLSNSSPSRHGGGRGPVGGAGERPNAARKAAGE